MQPLSITIQEAKDKITGFLTKYQSRFDDRKDDHFEAMELVEKLGTTAVEIVEGMESTRDIIGKLSWGARGNEG